jgi:hypothetical protein
MAVAIEDLVNQGLRDGGIPLRINDIYEGSEAARTALEVLGQARDELIDAKDWSFARRIVSLTLLKGPPLANGYSPSQPWSPIYPTPGFLYTYAYPIDCLNLRAVIPPPQMMPDLDPLPALWRLDNDATPIVSGSPPTASGPPQKVILCNVTAALAVYRAQITDPSQWSDPGFTEALVESLGKKFAVAFGQNAEQIKLSTGEAAVSAAAGSMERG